MQNISEVEPPSGWEWADDWHLDEGSVHTTGGWVYAPDQESLKWPESYDAENYVNYVRQRRWVRNRKQIASDTQRHVSVGLLKPGDSAPLPLVCLTHSGPYVLLLRPLNFGTPDEYAWSKVVEKPVELQGSRKLQEEPEVCISDLEESEKLLYCEQISGTSSNGSHGTWFCLSVLAKEIAKDIRSDPIQDWSLVIKSPLNIANYLPLRVEYSVLEMQSSGHFVARARGIFSPGKAVNVYAADVTKPLFLSLLPQKGWLPMHVRIQKLFNYPFALSSYSGSMFVRITFLSRLCFLQEAVPISNGVPSTTLDLRSSTSGRSSMHIITCFTSIIIFLLGLTSLLCPFSSVESSITSLAQDCASGSRAASGQRTISSTKSCQNICTILVCCCQVSSCCI